jgi:hypothetical protein
MEKELGALDLTWPLDRFTVHGWAGQRQRDEDLVTIQLPGS